MVLDRVEKLGLQVTLSKIPAKSDTLYLPTGVKRPRKEPEAEVDIKSSNRVLQLLEKMQGVCDSLSSSKRVCRLLSSFIFGRNYLQPKTVPICKLFHQPQSDFMSVLKDKLWRNFYFHQVAALHFTIITELRGSSLRRLYWTGSGLQSPLKK